jgi:hypothetical protein
MQILRSTTPELQSDVMIYVTLSRDRSELTHHYQKPAIKYLGKV